MTENKRFILVDIGFVRDNGEIVGMKDIVAIMNELYEENEQLKQKNQLLYEDIDFLKRFIEKRGFKAKLECEE